MIGECSTHGGDENCDKILVGESENKRPLEDLSVDGG
jgi:hypothetical protein